MWYKLGVRNLRYPAAAFAVVSVWMTYDNVFSDEGPIQELAEQTACAVTKKCGEKHGMVRMSRTPFGQSFDYEWRDRAVTVECRREYFAVGGRRCAAAL